MDNLPSPDSVWILVYGRHMLMPLLFVRQRKRIERKGRGEVEVVANNKQRFERKGVWAYANTMGEGVLLSLGAWMTTVLRLQPPPTLSPPLSPLACKRRELWTNASGKRECNVC